MNIIDLADEIGRPRLVEQALCILHGGDVRKNDQIRSARTGLALLGGSWERAYSLLDGTQRGGVRTHLLRVLHGGSLEAALTIDPRPVRCWEPAANPKSQAIRNRPYSVTLYDLLCQHGKLRARKQLVRRATINDIPQVQRLFQLLYGSDIGDGWYEDRGMQRQQVSEVILAARWRSLIHKKVPFLVAHDGFNIVGLVFGEQEKVVVLLVDPRGGVAFIPVLLEGIVRVMLNRGARRLKVSVSQADQRFFEEAGWRSSGAEARPCGRIQAR